jgi:GT2 family glycosyltransferase
MSEAAPETSRDRLGFVVIGRNEGERLRRSLDSLRGHEARIVYVDSGSTDGSPEMARARGVFVHALDLSRHFTAGRARNEGFEKLCQLHPDVELVQFLDGDCEVFAEWIPRAMAFLRARPDVAIVAGRRRERFPEATVYNLLCDLEWNTPIAEQTAVGGDAMMRAQVMRASGGYHPGLIGGEEPDLCVRVRKLGWNVVRLDADMTLHDVAMSRFGQWWKRAIRAGHAAANGWLMHGGAKEYGYRKRCSSALFWAALAPLLLLAALGGALLLGQPMALVLLALLPLLYAVPFYRARRWRLLRGDPPKHATLYAAACLIGKWPEALGVIGVWKDRLLGRSPRWIEYKDFVPLDRL